MSSTQDVPFDPTGPLPVGRLSIQASAGTGKTYALAGLATRYVVERGVPIGEVLLVTFTRAAAAELRDRVRSKLVEAAIALDEVLADPNATFDDEVISWLCTDDREVRRARAEAALADFDSAVITTIHGFAQQVLSTLGVAGGNPDAELGDDSGELLRQVCIDILVGESLTGRHQVELLPDLTKLLSKSKAVTGNPDIAVTPGSDAADSNEAAAIRRQLVDMVVEGTQDRRRRNGLLSFDDLLTTLRDALEGSESTTRELLRSRFQVALIDEFQDTDAVQWRIFSSVFGAEGSNTTLILVGDPKQAIYGFRGADIHTYRRAIKTPGTEQRTLGVNWRSDGPLLDGVEGLLAGTTFGASDIEFTPVRATELNATRRIRTRSGKDLPTVSLRLAVGEDLPRGKSKPPKIPSVDARRAISSDLAQQVRLLLEDGRIPTSDGERAVKPSDIAVLVVKNKEGQTIRDALTRAGIPAVTSRGDSVMLAPAFEQWRWLLEAVAHPARPGHARTACLSWFFGWSAAHVAEAGEAELATAQETLHRWGEILIDRGAVDFLRTVRAESGVAARLLRGIDGERAITDLDHISELLAATSSGRVGPAGLLAILNRIKESTTTDETDIDVAARRVESDAEAVQILTIHTSKGLEFPIVCCPSLWEGGQPRGRTIIYQDSGTGERTVDIADDLAWPDKKSTKGRKDLADEEEAGQRLRLLYVAMTRSQHQVILWWSSCKNSEKSALARILFARTEGQIDPDKFVQPKIKLPTDDEALAFLEPLLTANSVTTRAEVIGKLEGPPEIWQGNTDGTRIQLGVAKLETPPDRTRRRWSFSSISSSDGHMVDPTDESMGDAAAADEQSDVLPAATSPAESAESGEELDLPLGHLVGGREFGNLVHRVLEHVDFAAEDLPVEVSGQVDEAVRWEGLTLDQDDLTNGLCATITTPLGPLCADRSLRDFATVDRLDELGFELTLGEAGNPASDAAVGELLLQYLSPNHGLHEWAEGLSKGRFGTLLAGHLTGFVDVILRVRSDAGPDRFVVVDYKTNVLTPRGSTPTLADYHPDQLPGAMAHSHYPLQALLYSVALHRYLRWRIPEYDPTVHLGGIAYLFVRGMVGPSTPSVGGVPHGVFSWQPPSELILRLSDLLDGHRGQS